jgi:tRNA G46 methylase TrmB
MSLKHKLNRLLRKFNVELHGLGYLQSLAKGEFKSEPETIFQQVFSKDRQLTIIDAGANRGTIIDQYAALYPKATIHAFEPFPELSDALKTKYLNNKNIIINADALCDKHGVQEMHVNHSVDTNSLLE